ncbi:MAG: hypothetical protein HY260_15255 [Chloroflexi bacterium]|nr:hypothetical protein [Chloroflexota bacterium]
MKPHLLPRLLLTLTLLAFACNAPFIAAQRTGGGGGLLTVADPPRLLAPQTYADSARSLAQAIAELNRVQEQTIEHLRTSPPPETVDEDLRQTSAAAFTVAQLAEQLAASTANQAGGDQAATAAAMPYLNAAQVSYLTAIEAQNMRETYASGKSSAEEVEKMVAQMGSMLWSGDRFDPASNPKPFAESSPNPANVPAPTVLPLSAADTVRSQVGSSSGKPVALSAWASSSGSRQVVRVSVPAPRKSAGGRAFDPRTLPQLATADGQRDADLVRATAVARVISLGANKGARSSPAFASLVLVPNADGGFDIEIELPASLVFQSDFSHSLPFFADGTGDVIASADGGGALVSGVTLSDGQPQAGKPIEVNNATPLVTLHIDSLTPTGNATGDTRDVNLSVSWTTTLASPLFAITCFAGSGGSNSSPISTASGQTTITVPFSRLRDTAVCHAKLDNATLGESQVVEIEPAAEDANAQSTADAQETQNAAAPPTSLPPTVAPPPTDTPPAPPTALTLNGTFTLTQTDDGCRFSAAPQTGGPIQVTLDFAAGTASGTFNGGGNGVRPGLECTGNFGDLTWDQSYSGEFSGTVDANGVISATGTLSGTGGGEWSNCRDSKNQPFDCPSYGHNPYSYPITLTGSVDKPAGSGSGKYVVNNVTLPTTADWSATK